MPSKPFLNYFKLPDMREDELVTFSMRQMKGIQAEYEKLEMFLQKMIKCQTHHFGSAEEWIAFFKGEAVKILE